MKRDRTQFRRILRIAGLAAMAAAGLVTGAGAVPTTYAVSGVVTWSATNTDTIEGSFTYDPAGNAATMDVTLAGTGGYSQEAGTWDGTAYYNASQEQLFSQAGPANLYLDLGSDLSAVPLTETLTAATWICGYGCRADTTSVTADATSAPEPGSLALLGTGLAFISLTGRSRLRGAASGLRRWFT